MELNLTMIEARSGTRAERIVRIPRGLSVKDLAAGLGVPGTTLFLGRRRLDPAGSLAKSGVRQGAVIGIGGPVDVPDLLQAAPDGRPPVVVELHAVSGPQAGRVWRVGAGSHEIGADPQCAITLEGDGVPERGLWITVGPAGAAYWHRTEDLGGAVTSRRIGPPTDDAATLAVRVDDDEVAHEPAKPRVIDPGAGPVGQVNEWPPDEDLAVGPVLLRCAGELESLAAVRPADDGFGLDYNRPPRLAPHLDEEKLRLPAPPAPPRPNPFPLLVLLSPIVLGMVMVWMFNSYYFLVFTLLSPLMMVSNAVMSKKNNRVQHIEARRRYFARKAALDDEIAVAVARERRVRNLTTPDPVRIAQLATRPGSRLWERRRSDGDYLVLRVGTGHQPSLKELNDGGREENHQTIRWTIPDAPIAIALRAQGVLGIAGPTTTVRGLARWLTIQTAVLHSPQALRIVVLAEPGHAEDWEWVRWLPHLRPDKASAAVLIANDDSTTAARISELVAQVQNRRREASGTSTPEPIDTEVMVIADGSRRLRDVPGFIQVLTDGPSVGVYAVCLDGDERLLPQECSAVVATGAETLTVRLPGVPDQEGVRADLVTPHWCDQIARALAPIHDVSPEHDAGLPKQVKLLDVLDLEPPTAAELAGRWRRRPASTSFVLGADFDGTFTVDLVEDGPHGLIAGTTGSGKSELLQTMVASLAVANRPDELTFVLVDYKGGSAFKECAGLPHTLGMVTDLDPHLVERVLRSLDAELRRRERVLAAADAKDLPDYQAKRIADPELARLPRLLLVIDEFATMAREIPDFVPGLINIAQRGRSLGIHLILATQRPGGVVTPDIRANTNLRIALRVTDSIESQDVAEVSDAASFSPKNPGRAVIRRGPRNADLFQTAWVGAERSDGAESPDPPDPTEQVQVFELPWAELGRPVDRGALPDIEEPVREAPLPTDLKTLVEALTAAAAELDDFTAQPQPWQPALAPQILLEDLPDTSSAPLFVPYALEDLPPLQQQRVAGIDLETFGHLYVIGSPRSGRTQLLRTIAGSAAKYRSVADVHLYGIDAAGGGLAPLAALPHCGAVVSRHDMERLTRLLRKLNQELTSRQELAGQHNATGLTELRTLLPKAERPAHILVLIDGWDALAAMLEEHDYGQLLQDVIRLLREGGALGVHVIATSERSLLGGRLAAHNDHKLLLRQADRSDYQAAGLKADKVPAVVPPGRGWHVLSSSESQVAVLAAGGGSAQVEALKAIGVDSRKRDAKVPAARQPFPVVGLPALIEFSAAYELVAADQRRPLWALIGIGGDDGGAVGVDLGAAGSSYAVLGSPGAGRSNVLACVAVSLLAGGTSLVVITPRESPLRTLRRHPQVTVMSDADPSEDVLSATLEQLPGPKVVLVDDADLMMNPSADRMLKDIVVSGRDQGLALVFAATVDGFQSGLCGWASAARRARRGLLLGAQSSIDGELIGVRLGQSIVRAEPRVGRAWTTGPASLPVTVQVPLTVLRVE
ncbi:FtsK/SpoIIIE domain-containing protein [Kribbella sp. NBC_01505]|uniref:FtsK/SpoIIIE domain-containing protein n=1 Tax=Kribbella sp. NBC_01505 TaxID=2903580 RepID=UPI003869796C